jgi:hypothetical protein
MERTNLSIGRGSGFDGRAGGRRQSKRQSRHRGDRSRRTRARSPALLQQAAGRARGGHLRRESGADRARGADRREAGGRQAARSSGSAEAVRRQGRGRGVHRHAQSLARAGHHLGLPGRQRRILREAGLLQHIRRPRHGGGRAQNKRIVQIGMQGRTIAHKQRAMDLLHSGAIGQVYMARGDLLQAPAIDRPHAHGARSGGPRLGSLPRPRAHARIHQEPLSVQLALVLGHGQRRHRQPGHPRNGSGAAGPGPGPAQGRGFDRRQVCV